MKTLVVILQALCIIAVAPLLSGIIKKIKNTVRMRQGASILQPYYNLLKLAAKDEVVSETTSWIFSITPYVVFSSSIAALLIVPLALPDVSANRLGDALALIFILSTGRFFQSLAGLDAGSSFGGMGSSREMFISSFAEPAALLALFAVGFNNGSTSLGVISRSQFISISSIIASAALFLVAIAETSRIPVDNQETHLELTMVHEAMVLEYSGRSLALIELSSYIKQMVFFSLIAAITFPPAVIPSIGWMSAAVYICAYAVKIAAIAVIVAFLEVSVAKMRLFRVVDFLSFAFMLSCMAVVTSLLRL